MTVRPSYRRRPSPPTQRAEGCARTAAADGGGAGAAGGGRGAAGRGHTSLSTNVDTFHSNAVWVHTMSTDLFSGPAAAGGGGGGRRPGAAAGAAAARRDATAAPSGPARGVHAASAFPTVIDFLRRFFCFNDFKIMVVPGPGSGAARAHMAVAGGVRAGGAGARGVAPAGVPLGRAPPSTDSVTPSAPRLLGP